MLYSSNSPRATLRPKRVPVYTSAPRVVSTKVFPLRVSYQQSAGVFDGFY